MRSAYPQAGFDSSVEQHLVTCTGRWVQDAGGRVLEGSMVEVSPLVSCSGEDLAARCDCVDYGPGVPQIT